MWPTDRPDWNLASTREAAWRAWGSGLSPSEPPDRQGAEAACAAAYQAIGRALSPTIFWFDSPLAGCLAAYVLTQAAQGRLGPDWERARDSVEKHVISVTGRAIFEQVWAKLTARLAPLEWSESYWIGGELPPAAAEQERGIWEIAPPGTSMASVRIRLRDWNLVPAFVQGVPFQQPRHHAWRALIEQLVEEVALPVSEMIVRAKYTMGPMLEMALLNAVGRGDGVSERCDAPIKLVVSCGAFWLFRGAAVLTARPDRLDLDQNDRLHSDDGMALRYPDGWGLYASRGVRVTEQVILRPETLTSKQILNERNVEIRRLMIERLGLKQFLSQARAKYLDADQGGTRRLYRITLPGDEPIVAVRVRCPSTGQIYFLRVPPHLRSCRAAVAWTFGYEKIEDYQPTAET